MAQSKILVDTNSYIRLAQTIHPLLFQSFGKAEYCLYVLPELNRELADSKLENKFHWVNEEEFCANRKRFLTVGRAQKIEIKNSFEYVWEYVKSDFPGPSKVDVSYIAHALELKIPVVTDDQDMTELAKTFDVETMPTLTLLRLMRDCEHVSIETISSLLAYWQHITDLPANFNKDLKRLFPEISR